MAAMDNENSTPSVSTDNLTLSEANTLSNAGSGQILLVGPDGFVSPATIDESGVVREIQQSQSVDSGNNLATNDDILQQAFQEAGNDFVDESGSIQNPVAIDEPQDNDDEEDNTISYLTTEDGQIINSVIESTFIGEDGNQYAVIKSHEDGSQQIVMTGRADDGDGEMEIPETIQLQEQDQPQAEFDQQQLEVPELVQNGGDSAAVFYTQVSPDQPLPEEITEEDKPLGSSENPIRIIQQGNQYTSLQQLTPEQLQHIMQVLQQQQVVKPAQKQGTTTLYSPHTNTKIVYRVIYPGEKKDVLMRANDKFPLTGFTGRGRGRGRGKVIPGTRGRGRPRKFPLNDEEVDMSQFPELSKEEKDKKKKMRPRTRSGRVSKPPKHMVKDYKQIHLVDWAEDYDDSDGGYSDFHPSDEDRDDDDESLGAGEQEEGGYRTGKPRNYKCEVCGKCYVGQASLNRHYRINPSHGTPTDDGRTVPNGAINEESNSSSASTPGLNRHQRVFRRGKLPQRLSNLREVVKHFTNEELMEIVLPRLTQCVSTWEFMLMKSEKPEPGGTAVRPSIPEMLKEYELLLKDVRQYGSERLSQVNQEPVDPDNSVKFDDPTVAGSLGLRPSIWYQVTPDAQPYIPMKYKFSKAASKFKEKIEGQEGQGQGEGRSEEPRAKRVRIDDNVQSRSISNGPERILKASPNKNPHVRSLLTNQIFAPEQTINLMPSEMKGEGQGHGRIVVERGGNVSGLVSLKSDSMAGILKVSDLITIRPSDEDGLVMDTGGEVGDVTHSPEAMLQSAQNGSYSESLETGGGDESLETGTQDSGHVTVTREQSHVTMASPGHVTMTSESGHVTMTSEPGHVTMANEPAPSSNQTESNAAPSRQQVVNKPETSGVATVAPETETTDVQMEPEVDQPEPEVDQQAGGDAGNVVIMQTEDGMLLIQKPDGSTLQVQHSGEGLSMETVQYLLSMDTSQFQTDPVAISMPDSLPTTTTAGQ